MGNKLACQSKDGKKHTISQSLKKYEYIDFDQDLRPIRDQTTIKLINKAASSKSVANQMIEQAGMALDLTSQLIKREKGDLKYMHAKAPDTLATEDPYGAGDDDAFTYTKQDIESDLLEVKASKKRLKEIKSEIDNSYKSFFDYSDNFTKEFAKDSSSNKTDELDKELKQVVIQINNFKVDIEDAKEQKQKKEVKALKKQLNECYQKLDKLGEQRMALNKKLIQTNQNLDDEFFKFKSTVEKLTNEVDSTLESASLKSIMRFESKAKSLDLCFMLDCTGSMTNLIANAKEKMFGILDKLNKQFGGLSIRVGVVGYRDYPEDHRKEIFGFNTDVERARKFIANLKASTIKNSDFAEDVNGGFCSALSLDWKHATRTIVHIGDAFPHGSRFHKKGASSGWDNWPQGHSGDRNWDSIFKEIHERNINYIFLKLNSECDTMIEEFEAMHNAVAPAGKKKKFGGEFIHHQIDNTADNFLKVTTQTISKTVSKTVKTFGSSMRKTDGTSNVNNQNVNYKPLIPLVDLDSDSDDEDDFKLNVKEVRHPTTQLAKIAEDDELEIEEEKVNVSTHKVYTNKNLSLELGIIDKIPLWDVPSFWDHEVECSITYMTPTSSIDEMMKGQMKMTNLQKRMVIHKTPFAEGVFSKAYYAKILPDNSSTKPFKVVLKALKKPQNKTFFSAVLKKNTFVTQLADDYNKTLRHVNAEEDAKVFFVKVYIAKIFDQYYMVEPYIEGNFQKYTNNFDYVNESVPLLTAFSHFSYQRTKKLFMVNDLQGVNNILTDPGVHSVTKEFSHGDFGVQGMLVFFRNHVCNQYCKALNLKGHNSQENQIECNINRRDVIFNTKPTFDMCGTPLCNGRLSGTQICSVCGEQSE